LKAVARSLDSQFDVLLARDGQEALDLLASGSRADLVLADISRPELSGLQLMDTLRANADPLEKCIILMSAEEPATLEALPNHGCPVLRKPVSRSVLLTAIDEMMTQSEAQASRN
jgi:CheY-like chemotaxis protein